VGEGRAQRVERRAPEWIEECREGKERRS